MSGPLPIMPLDTLQAKMGDLIEEAKNRNLPMSTLTLLSISEYLKDAERWQFVLNNYVQVLDADMGEMMPNDFRKWVDDMRRLQDERQRLVRAGQRRVDAVSGNQGG